MAWRTNQNSKNEVFNNQAKPPRKTQIQAMIWKNFGMKVTRFEIKGEQKITN